MFYKFSFNINNMINKMLFIFSIFYFFTYEFCVFLYTNDNTLFIKNLVHKLAKKNMLYVKIFQAIILNNQLIDDELNNELLQYTDNAPWKHSDIDWDTIFKLEDEHNICFYNGHDPINAGMISLIFKVYKKDEQNNYMIIKMKRKNIDSDLDEAINNLLFLLYFSSFYLAQQ